MRDQAYGAGRQVASAQARGPALRLVLDREIQWGLVAVGFGDRACDLGPVGFAPACHQPIGRVEAGFRARMAGAFARDPPQHSVDEAGIAGRAPVGLGEPHREVDGGMVRHVEPDDLPGADQENHLQARSVVGNAAVERGIEQAAQCAESAQHGGDELAYQRAVTVGQRRQPRMGVLALEVIVERPPPPEDVVKNVDGNAPRRKPGDFRWLYSLRASHQTSARPTTQHASRESLLPRYQVMNAFTPSIQVNVFLRG
jgi:hypothetical protein